MAPAERIKCLLQVQATSPVKKFNGTIDCAIKLYKEGGIRSVYKGTAATLLRDMPASGAYFASYEYLKANLSTNGTKLNPLKTFFIGGLVGIVNWTVAMPFDVAKSRFQTAADGTYRNLFHVYMDLFKSEGMIGFYRGFTPVLLRAFSANAACILGYEIAINFLNHLL